MLTRKLDDLMVQRGGSIDPLKFKDETFELLSIPAFDSGLPEIVQGNKIGSTKKIVAPNDVLLSKIVPHIRRCWVVPKSGDHRQIASGEWIQFRGSDFFPAYLKCFLISDPFHSQFMKTVSGIGGLLLRARPSDVGKIEVPLPPLDGQIRIAHLHGKVEGLIAQRKQNLQQLDDLLKSVFLEMFGDPVRNERGWNTSTIDGFCESVVDCPHSTPDYSIGKTGYYCIRSSDIVDGYLDLSKTYQVDEKVFKDRITRYRPKINDIVYSREGGRLGNAARIIDREPVCLGQRIMLFQVSSPNRPEFLWSLLESVQFKSKLNGLIGGGAAPRVNIKDLKKLVVIKPAPDLQLSFSKIVLRIDQLKVLYQHSLTDLESLYGALSQQAFKGELDLSRVPLPGIKHEEKKAVFTAPLPDRTEESLAINLPDTGNLLDALNNAEAREALIAHWLEAYRGQLGDTPFSVQRFMTAAQTRLAELHPDDDFELGANNYEHIKTWVFDALAAGTLAQVADDERNLIQLKAVQK